MRISREMFEPDSSPRGGSGFPGGTGERAVTVVLSVVSLLGAVYVGFNFGRITAVIAIGIVNLLTSAVPLFVLILAVALLICRWKWRLFRSFWGW